MFFSNIILGIIQGITEFLPISSSGHLLILQEIFKTDNRLIVDILLHIATILAVIIYFYKDLVCLIEGVFKKDRESLRSLFFILITTFITGIIAIIAKDFFDSLFNSAHLISLSFLFTGTILVMTKKFMTGNQNINSINLNYAFILGVTQAIAITPGISRSGITIATLLFMSFKKEEAFRISFLVSIPAVIGALILEFKGISSALINNFYPILAGFIAALIFGLLSLRLLSFLIEKSKFYIFGFYCFFIAILTFIYFK
ncbi:MAG: undecaprenyl-diphosphate phosphatase [Candidatus Omnitrophota bacterium]